MKSLKQILQRMGWAESQAVNFIEKAGGNVPNGLPEDDSALLYHVRKLQRELSPHIDDSSGSTDDGSSDGGSTDDGTTTEPSDVEPVVVFDPDLYKTTEDLLTIPDSQNVFTERGNEQDIRDNGTGGYIRLDKDVGYPGGSQSMRYDYIDQEHNRPLHVGKHAPFSQSREIWMEWYSRWSTNFMDMENFPQQEGRTGGNTFAHKYMFIRCIAPGEPNNWTTSDGKKVTRVSLLIPMGGSPDPSGARIGLFMPATETDAGDNDWGWATHEDGSSYNYRELMDAKWHKLQLHVRANPGLAELWIDDEKVIELDGFNIHDEVVFTGFSPGRNKDDGLMQGTESLWWGSIKAWLNDPGW